MPEKKNNNLNGQLNKFLKYFSFVMGYVVAFYIGLYLMLIAQIIKIARLLYLRKLTVSIFLISSAKILLSTTVNGGIWCIGYIGYNHFKGTKDPDYEKLEE